MVGVTPRVPPGAIALSAANGHVQVSLMHLAQRGRSSCLGYHEDYEDGSEAKEAKDP